MKVTVLNSAICTTPDLDYQVRKISLEQARELIAGGFESAIGHQSTADILTTLLEVHVPMNRCMYSQEPGDTALIFKLKGRPEEGRILTAEEIEAVGYEFWMMSATQPELDQEPVSAYEFEYSDRQGRRDRRKWAIVISPTGDITRFEGKSIPGMLAIIGEQYEKAGKWSHTTYRLMTAPGVRFMYGLMGWETGTLEEGIGRSLDMRTDTIPEIAAALGVSVAQAEAWIAVESPKAFERLKEREAAVKQLFTA